MDRQYRFVGEDAMKRTEERRGRIAGQVLKLMRRDRALYQADLAANLDVSIDTVRAREGGQRPLSNVKVGDFLKVCDTLQVSMNLRPALLHASEADNLLATFLYEPEQAEELLAQPIPREVSHFLVWAVGGPAPPQVEILRHVNPGPPKMTDVEQRQVRQCLSRAVEASLNDDGYKSLTLRQQSYYIIGRGGAIEASSWLDEIARSEKQFIAQRALAVAKAFLGDTRPLTKLAEHLAWNEQLEEVNLGYMAWWAGERRSVAPGEVYKGTGEWDGQKTAQWLTRDLIREPRLGELNVHSMRALLERKGWQLLGGASPAVKAHVLAALSGPTGAHVKSRRGQKELGDIVKRLAA